MKAVVNKKITTNSQVCYASAEKPTSTKNRFFSAVGNNNRSSDDEEMDASTQPPRTEMEMQAASSVQLNDASITIANSQAPHYRTQSNLMDAPTEQLSGEQMVSIDSL